MANVTIPLGLNISFDQASIGAGVSGKDGTNGTNAPNVGRREARK